MTFLAVIEALFVGLRPGHGSSVQGLLVRVASLLEAASEAASEGDAEAAALLKASSSVLGAAIKSMGPEDVLSILPLNLKVGPFLSVLAL